MGDRGFWTDHALERLRDRFGIFLSGSDILRTTDDFLSGRYILLSCPPSGRIMILYELFGYRMRLAVSRSGKICTVMTTDAKGARLVRGRRKRKDRFRDREV